MTIKNEKSDLLEVRGFSDPERSPLWGYKCPEMEPEKLKSFVKAFGVPFCHNPKNNRGVVVFDGRRRFSSVSKILPNAQIIRSREAVTNYLFDNFKDPTERAQIVFGYGLTWARLTNEKGKAAVELDRIINDFHFEDANSLYQYVARERPELLGELAAHMPFYERVMRHFEKSNPYSGLEKTIEKGFSALNNKIKSSTDW